MSGAKEMNENEQWEHSVAETAANIFAVENDVQRRSKATQMGRAKG